VFVHLFGHLEPFVRHYGVAAISLVLTLESLGLPLPGESLLIVGSLLAGRGEISLASLLFFSWLGAVVGDNIGYLIGRTLGRAVLLRYGGKIGMNAERFDQLEATFARYGPATVVFARFVSVLRQLNGVVAGILGMSWWRFVLFNALGAALWVSVWTIGVFHLGAHISNLREAVHLLGWIGLVLAFVLLAVGLRYLLRQPDAQKDSQTRP